MINISNSDRNAILEKNTEKVPLNNSSHPLEYDNMNNSVRKMATNPAASLPGGAGLSGFSDITTAVSADAEPLRQSARSGCPREQGCLVLIAAL
ncbi:hypothetical protein NDU88_001441 [Pleurodeles waltl]|uniref:Uncharacterized protein n=1 Tax=Pleurodeles waltl TaxID=8319 RepID=A0AAV7UW28_PLEWA|nr:hypothetical protein NDU88_001441 [Pleurodeles waltl]